MRTESAADCLNTFVLRIYCPAVPLPGTSAGPSRRELPFPGTANPGTDDGGMGIFGSLPHLA